ncbi:MAG: hypothetical protein ACJ74M_02430 [Gaiellaceae bacterium]
MLRGRRAGGDRDIHLFLLWPAALAELDRILDDVAKSFRIHELVSVEWTPAHFGENLERFYGRQLPPGVDKLAETGSGDFLVAVVSDPAPRYRRRARTAGRERVNVHVFDAKQRYRAWTGGGHLVHATNDRAEAERDLFLLFGRSLGSVSQFAGPGRPEVERAAVDLVGARGWSSFGELLTAMEHSGGYAHLNPGSSGPPLLLTYSEWARRILKARPVDAGASRCEVDVAGGLQPLDVWWVGDGRLPAAWQLAILRDVSPVDGALTASPADRFYVEVHRLLALGRTPTPQETALLERLAAAAAAPSGDYGDVGSLRRSLDAYLRRRRLA